MLLVGMSISYGLTYGQAKMLQGVVVDDNNQTLPGASVFVKPENKGAITDEKGHFILSDLMSGRHVIEISYIGYQTFRDTIMLNGDKTYHAQLKARPLGLQEVIITDNYVEMRKQEESLNIEIVNDDYLKKNLGGSLMHSLERLPGVTTIEIGSGQSKPVIRGLGFNRVVVVENNIKHEAQQWGADHGLEIDQYAIENVEIIKGPASLMYGSDAIGGVIDLKNRKLPAENTFGGTIDLSGKTNNNFAGTSVLLYGRRKGFFAEVRATLLNYGDYQVPTDSVDIYSYRAALNNNYLRNTAGKENSLHASVGFTQNRFQSKFYVSNINTKSGFFANAHGLEPRMVDTDLHDKSSRDIQDPYQTVNHFKISNSSKYQWEKLKLEANLGFQRNFRQEWSQYVNHGYMPAVFPDTLNFNPDLERQFDKRVYTGNIKLSWQLDDRTAFNMGLNNEQQENQINGRGFIIPEFRQWNTGIYAIARHSFSDKSRIQLGVRYDYGYIEISEYQDWFPSPLAYNGDTVMLYLERATSMVRNFSNISWSVGYNYSLKNWLLKFNAGKSFRMPIAKELAANGVNYHHFSYEVGNPEMDAEISYQLDAGIEYHSKQFVMGASPFLNYFSNYIYLNPSPDHDRLYGNGNQVFYYTQSEVLRYGAELHAHYELWKPLQLGFIGEYVLSEQLSGAKKGFTLPFSPPASAIFNIKYQKQKIKFVEDAYISFDYRITAVQNHIVPPEETTDGYQVMNLGFGGKVSMKNQKIAISLQAKNLLNTKYFNHTSFYRLINVPEPGRNIVANITIPFSGKLNRNK